MPGTSDERRVLAAEWYAERIGAPFVALDRALASAYPGWLVRLAARLGPLRGLLLFLLARRANGIAIVFNDRGAATLLVLCALLRRGSRRVVLLELIPRYVSSLGPLYRLWTVAVLRPAVRRATAAAQVLSEHELRRYPAEFGLPASRFAYVPWPLSGGGARPPETGARPGGVLASGRAWCDWPTMFAAAAGRPWELTVVCRRPDLAQVRALNRDERARVLCEIPQGEHERLLREATVFVIAVVDQAPSAGQVRLLEATDAGTPIVVTRVPALAEYIDDDTVLAVPPGDADALRSAIERALGTAELRARLAEARARRAEGTSYAAYFDSVRGLVERALAGNEPGGGGAPR